MRMIPIVSACLTLSLVIALPACAEPAAGLNVSGGMTPNADGTASFEFRLANDRADITVKSFTVTVVFYDRTVAPTNKLAEYRWSFVGPVRPNTQSLEYGVLNAKAVADLVKRHTATNHTAADRLASAIYTYEARIDSQTHDK
ncbi:MAG: hypothetical protein HOP13_05485 [Alphaproteobacteria bacterium]|nr:hypothetical protein [Alphaproteobacteria bacterium]